MRQLLPYQALLLQQLDEGHEELPLVPIFIQVAGVPIAGGQEDQALPPQGLEEAFENGGICDVSDLEFVEVEEPGLLCPAGGNCDQRIEPFLAAFQLEKLSMDAPHELMEVLLLLLPYVHTLKEHVREETLAAATAPEQV